MAGTQYKERVVKVFVKVLNKFKSRLKPKVTLVFLSVTTCTKNFCTAFIEVKPGGENPEDSFHFSEIRNI